MKKYMVKDEFLVEWGTCFKYEIVDLEEVEELAYKWGMTIEEIMEEVDEVEVDE